MTYITINAIVTDLLSTIRGSEISASEPISKRQLESWVNQYRAQLIKRDLDKKHRISFEYVQEIIDIPVIASGTEYKTENDIPKVIDRNYEDGFTWIGTAIEEYQFTSPMRATWQQHRKYSSAEPYAYSKENALYTNKNTPLTARGIFEDPIEVMNYYTSGANTNTAYPIPMAMLPTLKQMILQGELGIEANAPSDDKNDSSHGVSSNTVK